jgi:hypothetical protein
MTVFFLCVFLTSEMGEFKVESYLDTCSHNLATSNPFAKFPSTETLGLGYVYYPNHENKCSKMSLITKNMETRGLW